MKRKRIHFMSDVEEVVPGAAYRCKRCGHATATMMGMFEHRGGDNLLFSACLFNRLKHRLNMTEQTQSPDRSDLIEAQIDDKPIGLYYWCENEGRLWAAREHLKQGDDAWYCGMCASTDIVGVVVKAPDELGVYAQF